jgi:hypothetical protein
MYRVMKTFISLLALVVIVFVYVMSANLYLQGDFFSAYVLVISAMGSIVCWIHNVGQHLQKDEA